jgi:hypothetical protein
VKSTPLRGVKQILKPCADTLSEAVVARQADGVLFVERTDELPSVARLRESYPEPERKRVCQGRGSHCDGCRVAGGRPETR